MGQMNREQAEQQIAACWMSSTYNNHNCQGGYAFAGAFILTIIITVAL